MLKSIGADKLKEFNSEINPASVQYFSKRKFKYPYFNIPGAVYYRIAPSFHAGLQTGIYTHYLEQYSIIRRTTLTVPLSLAGKYCIFQNTRNALGISMTTGVIFMHLKEFIETYKNSACYNASLFWAINSSNVLKFGIEKQVDPVIFDMKQLKQDFKEEQFKYSVNRLALCISYGFVIN